MIYVEERKFDNTSKPATYCDKENIPSSAVVTFGPVEVHEPLQNFSLTSLQTYYGGKKDG